MTRCPSKLLVLLLLLGTAAPSGAAGTSRSLEDYRQKAAALETKGDLPQALFTWRVVATLDPDDAGTREKIDALASAIAQRVVEHYKQGVAHFRARELEKARHEFLTTLRLNPHHAQGRFYLKRINQPDAEVYTVQPGDSFTQIATVRYNDAGKGAIIAYFNDLDPGRPLRADTLLLLPQIDGVRLPSSQEIDVLLERARQALSEKRYGDALDITSGIRESNPPNAQLQAVNDAARLGQGMLLMEQKQYSRALDLFTRISPYHKDRDMAIQKARERIQAQASEEKLRKAQAQYKKGAFKEAILTSRQVLEENPSNPNAQAISEASRYALGKQYLDQGEEILAIDTLKGLNPEYQDTAHLLAQAQGRLNGRAEEYYRKGVKHFLNEELEEAVTAWQKALELNPQHPKARQDMDNALRLLEKWRGLEKHDKNGQ